MLGDEEFVASTETRWGFVRPWCEVLKPHIQHSPPDNSDKYVWEMEPLALKVTMPRRRVQDEVEDEDTFRAKFHKVQEALALLAAVEQADCDAWRYFLTEHCGVGLGQIGEEEYGMAIAVKFLLDAEKVSEDGKTCYDLVRFFGTHQREYPSEEYLETLNRIAELDGTVNSGSPGVEIRIPVKLELGCVPANGAKILQDIRAAEEEIQKQWTMHIPEDLGSGAVRCTFVMQPMSAQLTATDFTSEAAGVVGDLIEQNMWFSQLELAMTIQGEGTNSELTSRKSFGQLLRRIFASTRRTQNHSYLNHALQDKTWDSDSASRQLGTLKLMCEATMPAIDFEAMCSAMVHMQTATELSLELEIDDNDHTNRDHWWMWLAYAVFSKRARTNSCLETLIIPFLGRLNASDVAAFTSVLTSEHPEELLCRTPRGRVDARDATLRSGAQIRWNFDNEGNPVMDSPTLTFETPIPFVRTFSDDGESEWINALVPGFGRCQVQRCSLDFQQEVVAGESNPCGLISLTLFLFSFSNDMTTFGGLLSFINPIGPSLKSLTLKGPGYAAQHNLDHNAIIRSCPNLQELTLERMLAHIQLDFGEYRRSGKSVPELTIPWQDVAKLANALCEPNSPLTKCVRRLRVSLLKRILPVTEIENGTAPNFQHYVDALVKMLEENQRIEFIEIQSPYFKYYFESFRKFHNKPIHRQRQPISVECKVAFLSVLDSRRMVLGDNKRKKVEVQAVNVACEIEQHVLSDIFSFAAPPIRRQVHFSSTQRVPIAGEEQPATQQEHQGQQGQQLQLAQ